jgi:5-methylcytosine-specific restriction endonuclease McrA
MLETITCKRCKKEATVNKCGYCKDCVLEMKRISWKKSREKKKLRYKTDEVYREKVKGWSNAYWIRNKVNCLLKHNDWYNKNKDKILTKIKTESMVLRLQLILDLGGKCKRCGNDDIDVLEFDHIVPLWSKNREYGNILREVKKFPERFQLLCANCHRKKTLEDLERMTKK